MGKVLGLRESSLLDLEDQVKENRECKTEIIEEGVLVEKERGKGE